MQRCIVHLDMDAFYAQVEAVRLGVDCRTQPYCLNQWGHFLAVNYPARDAFGIQRMDTLWDGKQKVLANSAVRNARSPPPAAAPQAVETPETGRESVPPSVAENSETRSLALHRHSPVKEETNTSIVEKVLVDAPVKTREASKEEKESTSRNDHHPSSLPLPTLLYSNIPLYRVGLGEFHYYPPNEVDEELGDIRHLHLHQPANPHSSSTSTLESSGPKNPYRYAPYNRTEFKVSLEPYRAASSRIFSLLKSFPGVEVAKAGIDEAFLDVTEAAEKELQLAILLAATSRSRRPSPAEKVNTTVKVEESGGSPAGQPAPAFPWRSLKEIEEDLLDPTTFLFPDKVEELNQILKAQHATAFPALAEIPTVESVFEDPMRALVRGGGTDRSPPLPTASRQGLEVPTDSSLSAHGNSSTAFSTTNGMPPPSFQPTRHASSAALSVSGATICSSRDAEDAATRERELEYFQSRATGFYFSSELRRSVRESAAATPAARSLETPHRLPPENSSCSETTRKDTPLVEGEDKGRDVAVLDKETKREERDPSDGADVEWTPVEEAFLRYAALLAAASRVVRRIREKLYVELRYDCSAGLAHNQLVAKILSASYKPRKQVLVWPHLTSSVMGGVKLKNIRGFGGKFGHQLTRYTSAAAARYQEQQRLGAKGNPSPPPPPEALRPVDLWCRPLDGTAARQSSAARRDPGVGAYAYYRLRGVDSAVLCPPKPPHSWSSLKEFPNPERIPATKWEAVLEGWVDALCHDLWCRHLYWEAHYEAEQRTQGLRYGRLVQLRVTQWVRSSIEAERGEAGDAPPAPEVPAEGLSEDDEQGDEEEGTPWEPRRRRVPCSVFKREVLIPWPSSPFFAAERRSSGDFSAETTALDLMTLRTAAMALLKDVEPSLLRSSSSSPRRSAPSSLLPRGEAADSMAWVPHPVTALVISFQYSKARKYIQRTAAPATGPKKMETRQKTLQGFFFRSTSPPSSATATTASTQLPVNEAMKTSRLNPTDPVLPIISIHSNSIEGEADSEDPGSVEQVNAIENENPQQSDRSTERKRVRALAHTRHEEKEKEFAMTMKKTRKTEAEAEPKTMSVVVPGQEKKLDVFFTPTSSVPSGTRSVSSSTPAPRRVLSHNEQKLCHPHPLLSSHHGALQRVVDPPTAEMPITILSSGSSRSGTPKETSSSSSSPKDEEVVWVEN